MSDVTAAPPASSPSRSRHSQPQTPGAAPARVALSRHGEEILRAVTPVVLGSLLPADRAARVAALDEGMTTIDDYLANFSLPLQKQVQLVFGLLASLPARVLLLGTWKRWRSAEPARIEAFLRSAQVSRIAVLRRFFALLHSLTIIAWFDQRAAWDQLGYPGPPIERPPWPEASL